MSIASMSPVSQPSSQSQVALPSLLIMMLSDTHHAPLMTFFCSYFQVLSLACCVFYSHCGNRAPFKAATGFRWFREFLFEQLPKWNATAMYQGWPPMHELKEQVCTNWLGPVGSASDYPVFSKWALYGEVFPMCLPCFLICEWLEFCSRGSR